ncbi:RNA pseudouridine synthase [Pseudorhodoferax sp. Leaf267]|uniref:RNA pseudouridine synthase n=1 Tax=Pseudorhodoferax sp. Leaf267 TaxID=1736316 RepID=UPI0006FF15DE|nr:RNA pseudouridine synthase [Pseudorhodoferax sp. Leaf267]KQP14109.1 RNA-binding protein [Pseudorhodoferax sp. Leaf267]
MTSDAPHHDSDAEGIRLAKRVAEMTGYSRREAELLIDNGVVRVDGTVAPTPQMRVRPAQRVEIEKNATPQPVPPVTIVLHKPPGVRVNPATPLAGARRSETDRSGLLQLPRHLVDQRCVATLAPHDSGLVVFTQVPGIERKLVEDAGILEHELVVEVQGAVVAEALQAMRPARVSVASQREGRTSLRFAIKGPQPGQVSALCERAGLKILGVRRLRLGRVALAGMAPGEWRYLLPDERF